jgi:ribonuclease PH
MSRVDGRKPDEIRQLNFVKDYILYPEGSVMITMGNTKVLCNATIEQGVPRWIQNASRPGGWITAEYSLLPRSTHTRVARETRGLRGRTQEIRRLIGRSLRAGFDLALLGDHTCIVDCDVIQADGGTRTAAITGGYVALRVALEKWVKAGNLPQELFLKPVAAISVGVVDGQALLDLNYQEDSNAEVDLNLAMDSTCNIVEIQGTAESRSFSRNSLDELLDLATGGIQQLLQLQQDSLRSEK